MKKTLSPLNWLLWSISILVISSTTYAADCPSDLKAVTAKDADLAVEILAYRVKPLTKCELEIEAQAWLLLLKEKITEISNAEVPVLYKKEEIKKVAIVEDALEEARDAKKDSDPDEIKKAASEVKQALKDEKKAGQKCTRCT